jgi:hypothetical protein
MSNLTIDEKNPLVLVHNVFILRKWGLTFFWQEFSVKIFLEEDIRVAGCRRKTYALVSILK